MPVGPSSQAKSSNVTPFHPVPGLDNPLKYFQMSPIFMTVVVCAVGGPKVVDGAGND
jgi:hypothetical protein